MQLGPIEMAVTVSGVVLIALTLWYLRPRSVRRPASASPAFQEVMVRILPDRFDPSTIILAANTPAKIRFQRIDGSDERETCVAPGLDIERKLPAGKITTIDVLSDLPGVYPFHSTVTRRDGTIVIAAA
ncbi:MAG TPA: cupredoxin domain-containing protein [Thermoanaerobaculia bacterium]|nr:cupredoxin domain-containing protein [Thermoanaerobaculia bacterium]